MGPPTKNTGFNSFTSNLSFDIFKKIQNTPAASGPTGSSAAANANQDKSVTNKPKIGDKKSNAWFDLFADLDPLANPAAMEKAISGKNQNCLDA